jgi:hypothetical protein
MGKSKYIDHLYKILGMRYCDKKKWIDIVRYLNTNYDIKATENSLIIFIRRYMKKNKWSDLIVFLLTANDEEIERAKRGDVPPDSAECLSEIINTLERLTEADERKRIAESSE